jgi:hypothetical protein
MRKSKFFMTGFRGTYGMIPDFVKWLSDTYADCSNKFMIVTFSKMFNELRMLFKKMTKLEYRVTIPDGECDNTTEHKIIYWFDSLSTYGTHFTREEYNTMFHRGIKDINELYTKICEMSPDDNAWKHEQLRLHTVDLARHDKYSSAESISWANSFKMHIFSDTLITVSNVVDIPLDNNYLMNLKFKDGSTQNKLLSKCIEMDRAVRVQGVVGRVDSIGIVGIIPPESVTHITQKQDKDVSFCLAAVMRVPIRSEIATTITMCQGQSIPNVALVVKDVMLGTQRPFFVGCTRHTDNFITNRNGARDCSYEPQSDILKQLLSPDTRHVY